jgi:hypothetical protein
MTESKEHFLSRSPVAEEEKMLGCYIKKGVYISSDLCFTFWVHVRMEMKAFHAGGIWQSTQIAR